MIRQFRADTELNFDPQRVQETLITPALTATGYAGSTSDAINDSGSVPERMLTEIVNADLVIADITVDNPNVYYELGVRHALRPAGTILIRARGLTATAATAAKRVPFDVQGWSYVGYDASEPGAALETLISTIKTARAAGTVDSPVFRLFPDLRIETTGFDVLPDDLVEEISTRQYAGSKPDLRLLADEVLGLRYELAALRKIAAAQSSIDDQEGALRTWEAVRVRVPADFEANKELGNLYARRNETARSDYALKRALGSARLSSLERSELRAQLARNRKDEWRRTWPPTTSSAPGDRVEQQQAALRSPKLDQAIEGYLAAALDDPGYYYPALNALALVTIQRALAEKHPDAWRLCFNDDDAARAALARRADDARWLADAARGAVLAVRRRDRAGQCADPYLDISEAELQMLSMENPTDPRITSAFQRAAAALGARQQESVTRQLELYRQLDVLTERREPIEQLFSPTPSRRTRTTRSDPYVVVFSGHTVDAQGRDPQRFPDFIVEEVKERIVTELQDLRAQAKRRQLVGFAAGSSGGDLLFHEACRVAGIDTEMFLTVPDAEYRSTGISQDVLKLNDWIERFNEAKKKALPCHVLADGLDRPTWRDTGDADPLWNRWIRWIFHHARVRADVASITALTVWDGKPNRASVGVFGFMQAAQHNGIGVRTILLPSLLPSLPSLQPPDTDRRSSEPVRVSVPEGAILDPAR